MKFAVFVVLVVYSECVSECVSGGAKQRPVRSENERKRLHSMLKYWSNSHMGSGSA